MASPTPARSSPDEFGAYWRALRPRLDEGCRRWVPELFRDLSPEHWEAMGRTLAAGKRLRGGLVCLMCEALGGKLEEALPRAVAVECIQAASLIHDDFVDQDATRRDGPATWTLIGARRAVLLGDLMFARAIRTLMELGREDGLAITQAIATMAQGVYQEPLDPVLLARAIDEGSFPPDRYEGIIRLKTGALFATAARLGALAARATCDDAERATRFGMLLGETYQLADDLHEVLQLGAEADGRRGRFAALAPVLLYFFREEAGAVTRILRDGEGAAGVWTARVLPVLEGRMREDIRRRAALALEEISGLPDTSPVRLLRATPFEAVRMQDQVPSWP